MYATKYDLRKTTFRLWKSHINGEVPKAPKRTCTTYTNVENNQKTSTVPQSSPPQPQSPTEISSPQPQSPTEISSPQPQSPTEISSPQPQSPTEISSPQPQSPTEISSPQPQSPTEISSPQSPTATKISLPTNYSDTMELKIPLLRYNTPKKSTVTTQTLQITTEQEIQPLTINDIPAERISELIEQLRQDPDLRDIFTDIEQQIEFEELGMDLEIPELNSLEDELFW